MGQGFKVLAWSKALRVLGCLLGAKALRCFLKTRLYCTYSGRDLRVLAWGRLLGCLLGARLLIICGRKRTFIRLDKLIRIKVGT